MAISHGLQADIQSLQAAYYDEDCYRGALEKALREHAANLTPEKRRSYETALRLSLQNLDCIRVEIEKRRADVGRVEMKKEIASLNQKIAA